MNKPTERPRLLQQIDQAIAELPADAIDIEVSLFWPHYQELLALKGLNTDASQIAGWGGRAEKRPLKVYKKYPLKYSQFYSCVIFSLPDGSIGGARIKYEREDDV